MNFDYSYRAFLISCLLVGNLVLLLVSVKMKTKVASDEDFSAIEYAEILEELEKDEQLLDVSEMVKIETNRAYNEAEEFISELENSRLEALEAVEENNEEEDNSEENTLNTDFALNEAQDKLDKVREKLANDAKNRNDKLDGTSSNRKTTISYSLKDRKAMRLRNPVYTCESGGKIVISIEVNALGRVVKSSYNKSASTTSNGCLIDSAMEYANKAKFTTAAGKDSQLGTITYTFPGQG